MQYYLADTAEAHHETATMQRFDPAYWTMNFPRPMFASCVTTAPDALRVDCCFQRKEQLAGLIWESADTGSHPLLAYAENRDYRGAVLSFRWQSSGIRPLDAVWGPVLTIEGRDANGSPRAWYVRLWNYANGTPNDCQISLPFSALSGGFLLPSEADPVYAGDIDRMFISLTPSDYDGSAGPLDSPQDGWAELSDICCTGGQAVLKIGNVMLPENGLACATGYDDLYNLTPERLLRQIRAMGYRGSLVHYVGMSHYYRVEGAGDLVLDTASPLNQAAISWHKDFLQRSHAMGFSPILSLSYELLAANCPQSWMQRAYNNDPALTGWQPPSSLLSPAHAAAMSWLQSVGVALAGLALEEAVPLRFQIGEPWWWSDAGGRVYLYDDAAKTALGGNPPEIADVSQPLSPAQTQLLDDAGALLAASTAALADAVRGAALAAGKTAETLLLVYLPTILDASRPELKRANLPTGWASPAFDRLQLEDYDWATAGYSHRTKTGVSAALEQLQYPLSETHYFAGFVLDEAARDSWQHIISAADDALARGHAESFIWAWPQIARDGLVAFAIS